MSVTASLAYLCPGESDTLMAARGSAAATVTWAQSPADVGKVTAGNKGQATYLAPKMDGTVAQYGDVVITATDNAGSSNKAETASFTVHLAGSCGAPFAGDLMRATVGYQQIGSSGAQSAQKYSFDFFITRPLPYGTPDHYLGSRWRWWGDIGLGSYPQQVAGGVATLAGGFADSAAKLKVSQLVQTADFNTGVEWRISNASEPVRSLGEATLERFVLTAFAGVGAVGPMPPGVDTTVFAVPNVGTPQRKAFDDATKAYGGVSTAYVAFPLREPDRFLWNVTTGFRLYTLFTDQSGEPLHTAPAMVSVGIGQNVLVSPDRKAVWHASASYPFPIGDRADPKTLIVNLFGEAWMAFSRHGQPVVAYQLTPAMADGKPVPLSDPGVTIIPTGVKPRDTYRIGVSLDLLKVWERLGGSGK